MPWRPVPRSHTIAALIGLGLLALWMAVDDDAYATFFWRRGPIGTAVGLAWLGQNCGNIARYAADARAQALPLVGGGEHDWFHILSRWHALGADHTVAAAFRLIGWALVLGAAAWLAWPLRPGADRATGSSGS